MIKDLVMDDVSSGCQLSILVETSQMIVSRVLHVRAIASKSSISESWKKMEKERLTHNQSLDFSIDGSINGLLIRYDILSLKSGSCLLEIIYFAHELRLTLPKKIIVVSKIDLNSTCRRAHLCGVLEAMTMTAVGTFALIYLRLPFDRVFYPWLWRIISELICDVASALLRCDN